MATKKQFKTESKKLLDMMINSIYTHKEIFLRELISNASDAIDKLYFKSLTDSGVGLNKDDFEIRLTVNKDARTITVEDNGCGMSKDDLEKDLGTIAKSGSLEFKSDEAAKKNENIDIIGQFGVGFYSAFMIADEIVVESKAYGEAEANRWESTGADGYSIEPCEKEKVGTKVILHIKADTDDEKYSEYLDEYRLHEIVKKYSDYIRYPIKMLKSKQRKKEDSPADNPEFETYLEDETLNSMIPLWKKPVAEVKDEEYNQFYMDKYFDYEAPLKVVHQKAEGTVEFTALMFIPSRAPYNYYSRGYEKGLQLYSGGVMIMDKCKDLLPDYFSFVKGLVDSADLSLNVSRELLQHDRQLKVIAKSIEKKIASTLADMLANDKENYKKFFKAFGTQLKYGIYNDYGAHKDVLQDLLIYSSSFGEEPTTLKEYVSRMKEGQTKIYYACGDSAEKIKLLPQVESVIGHGYEVLYLTDEVDEFALQMLMNYDEKEFLNVCKENLDLTTDAEKETLKTANEGSGDMFTFMKESLDNAVTAVKFTNALQGHPVCLSSEGVLSVNMQKTLSKIPGAENGAIKAELVLEINLNHPIAEKLKALFASDKDKLAKYTKILYANARLISGLDIDNASELAGLVCDLM